MLIASSIEAIASAVNTEHAFGSLKSIFLLRSIIEIPIPIVLCFWRSTRRVNFTVVFVTYEYALNVFSETIREEYLVSGVEC